MTSLAQKRSDQARLEIGETTTSRRTAVSISIVFLLVIGSIFPFDQLRSRSAHRGDGVDDSASPLGAIAGLLDRVGDDVARWRQVGWIGVDRLVLREISQFETDLETGSVLHQKLLPAVQWPLTRHLGLGNENAYVGRDGWLYYRPDIDAVIGRGFLDPRVQEARAQAGKIWEPPVEPDPLPALLDLGAQLDSLGVELLIAPTPVKSSIYPEMFNPRFRREGSPPQNVSFQDFLKRAADRGLWVVDSTPVLMAGKTADGREVFLRTDSHWTPAGLETVAVFLAESIAARGVLDSAPSYAWLRRSVMLESFGDIAKMLLLPADQKTIPPDRLEAQLVTDRSGRLWRATDTASVLLLGDSFSNVFSDVSLGWGSGAGLAEQLSFHLARPVDKIARNAGGALGSRQALRQAVQQNPERLEDKQLVIYQFAVRELSQGDWRRVDLEIDR